MSTFTTGQSVTAKTMGRNSKEIAGVVKEVVPSLRGEWVVVTDSAGVEHKTRPGLVTAA